MIRWIMVALFVVGFAHASERNFSLSCMGCYSKSKYLGNYDRCEITGQDGRGECTVQQERSGWVLMSRQNNHQYRQTCYARCYNTHSANYINYNKEYNTYENGSGSYEQKGYSNYSGGYEHKKYSKKKSPKRARFMGCFEDRGSRHGLRGHDLNGFLRVSDDMTNTKCQRICKHKGFRYFATQHGNRCYCGDRFGRYGKSYNCNQSCAGDNYEICGGYKASSVYKIRRH